MDLSHLIASTLAPYRSQIELTHLAGVVGALLLASEPSEEEAPVTERDPVTIRTGAYVASGYVVRIAA